MPNNDSTAPSLSDFFSALSEEKADQRKKLRERINAPESELSTLFSQLQIALEETNKESQIEAKDKLEEFSNLMKSAAPPKKKESIDDVKTKNEKIEVVAETVEEETVVEKEEPITTEVIAVAKELEEQSGLISETISALADMKTDDVVNEEVDPISALRVEFEKFKTHIQRHISNQDHSGAGSGEVRLEFLDDVQSSTAKVDGKLLKYSSSDSKWIGADAGTTVEADAILLNGTDGSSSNAGDSLILDGTDSSSSNAGDELLHEDSTNDPIAVLASHGITLAGVGWNAFQFNNDYS